MAGPYSHAVDLRRNLQPVEVHVQLDVVLLHQLVLDAVDFGHDGDGRPGVLGPREGDAGQHLLFTLQEEIVRVRSRRATGFVGVSLKTFHLLFRRLLQF